jgi:hypothetical protein
VICEVKGVNDNVTKMHVAQVDNHRKQNKLADTFPGLLVVNTLATAKSFREKEQEVHPDVSDRVAQENVLVLRTLDLFWLLDAVDAGQLQPCHLVKVFTSKKGWLKVEPGDACQALQE